jgi:exopolyphosphatase/guanosine-5'-triphosphate,3'-diphosphate pyrophosphatase
MDIGTNSVKILVARVHLEGTSSRLEVLRHDVRVTRMGEGLNATGRLAEEPMGRAIEAIRGLADEARALAPLGISALGMEAFRQAANGSELAGRIQRETGIPVRILGGREEASLGREGVVAGFGEALPTPVLVVDVGGGSAELALTEPAWEISVPRGAVTTTERYLHSDPPSGEEMERMRGDLADALEEAWRQCPLQPRDLPVIAVGGTVTSYATMHLALGEWDPERVHRLRLTLDEIRGQTDRLAAMPLASRRSVVGLNPARAPVIVGGGAILEAVLRAVGADSLRVSLANLLHAHVTAEVRRWYAEHQPQHA